MTQTELNVSVRRLGAASVMDIEGEVTTTAESALSDAFTEAASDGVGIVILNFAGMEYMNSGGIGLIVTLLIRANRQNVRLVAVGLNEHYQHIFELTRLDEAILIYADESEALKAKN